MRNALRGFVLGLAVATAPAAIAQWGGGEPPSVLLPNGDEAPTFGIQPAPLELWNDPQALGPYSDGVPPC